MMAAGIADNTPVLVGVGTATRREQDFSRAPEPMDLMLEAVAAAGYDSTVTGALPGTQYIAVPKGRWSYRNPAAEIGRAIAADRPTTVLTTVGVLQQTLISEACVKISNGEIHTALVAGADSGYRLLRAQIAGSVAGERMQDSAPDITMAPAAELRHPAELAAGLQMPVGPYAIMESARRASQGLTVSQHRDRLAELGAAFSRVAMGNPRAWQQELAGAAAIREASPRNPMQAFPYTRAHCSNWNVDQAAALLLCSAARARALGIARRHWIFPRASAESNHMVPVCARASLDTCAGAELAGRAVLAAAGIGIRDVDLVDLYSCFPLAVTSYAQAIGLRADVAMTITGGMAFAGGPYNNYLFQATCRAAELLRAGRGRNALLSCVSGVLTKQAFCLWSVDPGPAGFVRVDVSEAAARRTEVLDVLEDFTGAGRVAGYTVLHSRAAAPVGVLLVDTAGGARAVATCRDAALLARLQQEEFVGRQVHVEENRISITQNMVPA